MEVPKIVLGSAIVLSSTWREGYFLDSPMISIQMGGNNVVLGVQWLQLLGTMALNFQYIFMIFSSNGKEIELRGIQGKPCKTSPKKEKSMVFLCLESLKRY
jgi:hypothetical protein